MERKLDEVSMSSTSQPKPSDPYTLNSTKPTINTTNCSVALIGTAATKVEDGTGAYAGITGKVAITITFAGIAPKTAKGCNLAPPRS